MEWQDQGVSSDIEDRRGGGGGGFGFGGGMGIGGFILVLIISVITGRNFFAGSGESNLAPGPSNGPVTQSTGEERDVHLISFVLDDAQNTWAKIFAAHGRQYRHAKLVLYRDMTYSGCGNAQATTGPFYCPQDEKIYIDLSFWQELQRFGGDTGDFAQAYVITHELGHHVQKLLGIEQKMRQYEVGEKFVRGVIEIGGERAIDHAWVAPENLPVIAELDDPNAWLARVQNLHAAGR